MSRVTKAGEQFDTGEKEETTYNNPECHIPGAMADADYKQTRLAQKKSEAAQQADNPGVTTSAASAAVGGGSSVHNVLIAREQAEASTLPSLTQSTYINPENRKLQENLEKQLKMEDNYKQTCLVQKISEAAQQGDNPGVTASTAAAAGGGSSVNNVLIARYQAEATTLHGLTQSTYTNLDDGNLQKHLDMQLKMEDYYKQTRLAQKISEAAQQGDNPGVTAGTASAAAGGGSSINNVPIARYQAEATTLPGLTQSTYINLYPQSATMMPFTVTTEELCWFHSIDRELLRWLVVKRGGGPHQMMKIIALWMWLEAIGFPDIVDILRNSSEVVLDAFVEEALICLNV